MSEMFDMGGYGLYVWGSYAIFAVALIWDLLAPRLRQREVLRALHRRMQRENARKQA